MALLAYSMQRWRTTVAIALRNLIRARHRSVFGIVAVGFGMVALLLAGGFIEWAVWSMRETLIGSRLGHIQVAKPRYFDVGFSDPYRFLLPDNAPELEAIQKSAGVKSVAPRFHFTGLVSKGEGTLSFLGEGIEFNDPALQGVGTIMIQGRALKAGDTNAVMLGRGLAENLGAKAGERITLVANTRSGGINAVEATVVGTFASSTKAFEDVALQLPRALALKLVRGEGAHTWVVTLTDTAQTDAVAQRLAPMVKAAGWEITPWHKLADFYNKAADLFRRQTAVMKGIVALIIVLCISNTLLMTVAERTGEIGTSMALGLRRRAIFGQFMTEGVLLGCVGSVFGVLLGFGLAQAISAIGIPMPPPPDISVPLKGQIRLDAGLVIEAFLIVVVTTAVASAYPAWRACRMEIVNALRFNR